MYGTVLSSNLSYAVNILKHDFIADTNIHVYLKLIKITDLSVILRGQIADNRIVGNP